MTRVRGLSGTAEAVPFQIEECVDAALDHANNRKIVSRLGTSNKRFAPEDLKIGDRFQERIEESIRVHDKLLLVLSENSVLSPWVEREVQAAFEREHRSKKLVLFPIRVDEAVMEASKAWAADIRRTRHIGEFGNWRDHNSYKKALERLLRDLKNSG